MTNQRHITVGDLTIGNDLPLTLIAGPCAMESRQHALETSLAIHSRLEFFGLDYCFNSSDREEGIQSFLEKRPPKFQGK